MSSGRCDAYTPVRWNDRRCDAPATHALVSEGVELGEYCEACFQGLVDSLNFWGAERDRLTVQGVPNALADRIIGARIDRAGRPVRSVSSAPPRRG